ncbi:MAG: alpha-1,2-fucosyltransferase [Hyphomicrobiales bacterium]|nr:alpha-1,2-fucosyltransferase [Hyphomicrobiales bacterium]
MAKKVIAHVIGGLGNQLFQYATARAVAFRYGAELILDLRHFRENQFRAFGLDHFMVRYKTDDEILPPRRHDSRLRYHIWRRLRLSPRKIREHDRVLDTLMRAPQSDIYLEGYWQSESYFKDVEREIRRELRFANPPHPENQCYLDAIKASPAVSLHIRRGDYLLPEFQTQFGSCSLDYYQNAITRIATWANIDPVVYVFSDDLDWARDNLSLGFQTRLIGHNGPDKPQEDLRLMSSCRHHVIANSTFSWWGAWLNPSPDKIVVAPKRWFADQSLSHAERTPPSWHRLDN